MSVTEAGLELSQRTAPFGPLRRAELRLDDDTKRCALPPDCAVELDCVYLTDIALCAVVVQREGVQGHQVRCANDIARLMRTMAACAIQLGLFGPCICIALAEDQNLLQELQSASSNQDWHRGDFAMLPVDSIAAVSECVSRAVLGTGTSEMSAPLKPISTETFIRRLNDKGDSMSLSELHRALISQIITILRHAAETNRDGDTEYLRSELDAWIQGRLDCIGERMREADLDATENM